MRGISMYDSSSVSTLFSSLGSSKSTGSGLFLQYFCGIFPYFGYNYEKITISFRFVHILFTIRCYYKNIKESKVTNLLFFHNSPHCPLDNGALLFLSRNFLNVFYLPVNRLDSMFFQKLICLTEMSASKEPAIRGKRTWMRCL